MAGLLRRLVRIWIEMMAASCANGEDVNLHTLKKLFDDETRFRTNAGDWLDSDSNAPPAEVISDSRLATIATLRCPSF